MYKCNFNAFVECNQKICSKCGWNPEVAEARLEEFRKKLEEELKDEEQELMS